MGQDASADKVDKYGDGTGPVKTPFPWREASHPEAVPQGLLATLASWMLSEADPSVEVRRITDEISLKSMLALVLWYLSKGGV